MPRSGEHPAISFRSLLVNQGGFGVAWNIGRTRAGAMRQRPAQDGHGFSSRPSPLDQLPRDGGEVRRNPPSRHQQASALPILERGW